MELQPLRKECVKGGKVLVKQSSVVSLQSSVWMS
jgi:hypothetical protein